MLGLKDFVHLPEVEPLFEQVAAGPGLVIVAGLDARPQSADNTGFVPSGRATIFRILVRAMMGEGRGRAVVVSRSRDAVRVPRQFARRVEYRLVKGQDTYQTQLAKVTRGRPGLLVVDRLDAENVSAVLNAAAGGLRVLAQLDTVFSGGSAARHLLELGAQAEALEALSWVVTAQRLPALCKRCKQPDASTGPRVAAFRARYPDVALDGPFYRAGGCADCAQRGFDGDLAAFDVFHAGVPAPELFGKASELPLELYGLRLAALGHVALDDAQHVDAGRLGQAYNLLVANERELSNTNAALQRKLAELEAANRVLQQRTEALLSLEDLSRQLVAPTGLLELAARVCQHACALCGADRAIVYFLHADQTAEVLAVSGWDQAYVHERVASAELLVLPDAGEPLWPPGIPWRHSDVEGVNLRSGRCVSLVAHEEPVGVMLVHAAQRNRFRPGDVALLEAFANQAALAMQRAGLIESLRQKVVALEAAQAELVNKERLERELELARQVQQSMLPRLFPMVPGYTFAARSEPARRVGGDFYDVVLLDGDRFGVVVADVSDKGMPAALFMAVTRSVLVAEARRGARPREVLENVNRLLLELGDASMFVTVFYGVIDGAARRLHYARAGHDRPLCLRGGAAWPLGGQGTVLGTLPPGDFFLTEESIDLMPGDRLVLYTDGLIDALNAEIQVFGLGRLVALLEDCATSAPDVFCEEVFAALDTYRGGVEQYDDMTVLVVEVA